ncbi:MAG: type IV pilin protein [Ramlibacter sp.]
MKKTKVAGFTLIELMITVAIVAILGAVAYPSYLKSVVRGKRAAAQSFMATVANKQEAAILNARTYFSIPSGAASEWTAVSVALPTEVQANYTVTVVASGSPSYTVTAVPTGKQAVNDTRCGTLTLTHTGVKGKTGTAPAVSDCW